MFIENKVHDEFMTKLTERVGKMRQGNNLDETTQIGPQVSEDLVERIVHYVQVGQKEGAKLVCGGERPQGDLAKGYFVKPTIFDGVKNNMQIAQEEIFGPDSLRCFFFHNSRRSSTLKKPTTDNFGLSALSDNDH